MKLNNTTKVFSNPDNIIGFGEFEFELDEKSQASDFYIDVLINALNSMKTLGFEKVCIRIQDDWPMLITKTKKDTNGLIICPLNEDI